MKKIKVLWPHNFNTNSIWAGNFMKILARGMSELGVDIHLEYLGNLRNPFDLYKARKSVRDMSSKFDIVHSQFGSACALACASAKSIKVLSLRGSDWHVYKGKAHGEWLHNELAVYMSKISLSNYNKIIVMSERMKEEVAEFSSSASIHVIPDAVDDAFFEIRDREESRRALGYMNDSTPWVLFTTVSIEYPIKRAYLAQEAIKHLHNIGYDVKLQVASGIAPDKMPLFVSSCNLVLCTSTHEGWPNSVKEALACGLPFVSTDVSDLKLIADNYPACSVVGADPISIANAILKTLEITDLGHLRNAVIDMNVEKTCKKILRCYESALD